MSKEVVETKSESPLRMQLRSLTEGFGLWRDDLLCVMQGEAPDLCEFWGIPKEANNDIIRDHVRAKLKQLFGNIPQSRSGYGSEENREILREVFEVAFNLAPEEDKRILTKRQAKELAMDQRTAQRWKDFIFQQFEVQIRATGFIPRLLPSQAAATNEAAAAEESTESPARTPWHRRRPLQLAGLAGAVLLATAIVVPLSLSEETNGTSPPVTSTPNGLPSTMKGAASPAPTGPPPPPLIVEVQSIRDAASGWHVTFDRAATAGTTDPEVLASSPRASFPNGRFDEFLRSELAAGGYLAGGAMLKLQVSGVATGTVEVTDVRPVIEKREPIKDGLTVVMGTQGNELDESMGLQLDEANPVAKDYDPTQMKFGKSYFLDKHIRIAPNTSDTINIMTLATRYSYTFRIAIDYTVDGKRGIQTVSLDGATPFRVTPDFCGTQAFDIPSVDRDKLRTVRYATVHAMGVDPAIANYAWKEVDPAGYSANCGG